MWFCSSAPPPGSLLLQQDQQNQQVQDQLIPPTPDVDLLLECTFSYMHNSEEDGDEPQPIREQEDEFLSPLIGPDDEDDEVETSRTSRDQ